MVKTCDTIVLTWPSGKLPIECQKNCQKLDTFSKKLTKMFIFFNKIANGGSASHQYMCVCLSMNLFHIICVTWLQSGESILNLWNVGTSWSIAEVKVSNIYDDLACLLIQNFLVMLFKIDHNLNLTKTKTGKQSKNNNICFRVQFFLKFSYRK